jgi:hypothetical protein
MRTTIRQGASGGGLALAVAGVALMAYPAVAQEKRAIEERKALYAPWSPDQMAQRRKEQKLVGPGSSKPVPPPAFPSYLKKPNTVDELMPQARAASRQIGGRTPLGLVESGQSVMIVVGEARDAEPNFMVQEAIKRALEERGVKVHLVTTWDLVGATEADTKTARKAVEQLTIADGQRELESFFAGTGSMPNPQKGRDWVRQEDPDLYKATWPETKFPNEKAQRLAGRDSMEYVGKAIQAYIDKNPDVRWVFWRSGGRTDTRKAIGKHQDKFLGNYTYLDLYDLMSQVPAFPGDVWRLIETKTIEPLGFVDRVEVTDPEGTAFGYDVNEEAARRWAQGVYQQGHLFMFPAQSTGRYPYSLVEYPSFGNEYIKPVLPEVSGVIASTLSHSASHPRMEIQVTSGKISDIKGGGLYGEGMRLLLRYPGTQDKTWPHFDKPGYWWLYEAGTGTNPKYFKHPAEVLRGNNLSERNNSGVVHWAFGTEAQHGPEKTGEVSPATMEFGEKHQLPTGHSMHHHNTLPTFQVRVRDLDQWLTLVEHGGLTALNDLYVRALASRYGNPDHILRRDYVTPIPGINMPGSYDEYARNPGAFWVKWAQAIEAGKYEYFKP